MAIKRPYQMKTISSNLFVIDRKSYQRKKDKDKEVDNKDDKDDCHKPCKPNKPSHNDCRGLSLSEDDIDDLNEICEAYGTGKGAGTEKQACRPAHRLVGCRSRQPRKKVRKQPP